MRKRTCTQCTTDISERVVIEEAYMNLPPEEHVAVVEAPEVLVLPEQLDGRLGTVPVQLGHVQVVNEEDDALVTWGT